MISTKITPDRSKIVIEREDHVKYWTRHFGELPTVSIARVNSSLLTPPLRFGNNLLLLRRPPPFEVAAVYGA
jgi:hypothetical protein